MDPVDLVIRDAGEGVGESGLGIEAVQFCGFDRGVGDGSGSTAGLRTNKEVVFSVMQTSA